MSPSEVYFWTTLPKVGDHLMVSGLILTLVAALLALPVAEMTGDPKWLKRAFYCCVVASLCFWGFTLLPNEKQVEKILTGKVIKDV